MITTWFLLPGLDFFFFFFFFYRGEQQALKPSCILGAEILLTRKRRRKPGVQREEARRRTERRGEEEAGGKVLTAGSRCWRERPGSACNWLLSSGSARNSQANLLLPESIFLFVPRHQPQPRKNPRFKNRGKLTFPLSIISTSPLFQVVYFI